MKPAAAHILSAATFIGGTSLSGLVLAQQPVLEHVIVTAERREQNVQDIGASLGVIDNEEIMRLGLDDFLSYSRSQPGVVMHQPVKNRSTWNIRGINTDIGDTQLTQEPVAVYINDMPVSQPYASLVQVDLRLYDIERIEVLRGPQGTLFGSGTLGGLVRVLTTQPNMDEFEASVRLDVADVDSAGTRTRIDGMVNIPINNELALRAVAYTRDEPGWVENIGTGDENSSDDYGGRLALKWQPNDRFDAKFEFMYQNSDPDDGDAWNPDIGKFKRDTIISEERKTEFTQYNLTLNYDFPGFANLLSSTNYQETESNWLVETGEIPGIGKFYNDTEPYDTDFFVQELRLVSNTEGPLEWVTGLFYSEVETDDAAFAFVLPGLQDWVEGIVGPGAIDRDELVAGPFSVTSTEYAAYGDVTYHIDEAWSITGGLRAFYFESDYTDGGTYVFDFDCLCGLEFPGFENNADDNDLTWRTVLSYQPDDRQHYYLNISKGYRVGQVNPNFGPSFVDPEDVVIAESYDPDESINYELGAKTAWLDNTLQLNVAIYYIDWTDVQVDAIRPSDARNYIANAGDAESKGIELEMIWLASANLDLRLMASWQDSEIVDINAENSFLSGAKDGDTMPGTPDYLAAAEINYRWALENGWDMAAYLNAQYVDESPNRFSNQAATGLPHPDFAMNDSYENVDLGLSVSGGQWDATLYMENATNNDDIILDVGAVATASGENKYITLRPRTVGARLNYRF
ncbi:MAG: TonB-dependent receptor [Halioglobus sp.]